MKDKILFSLQENIEIEKQSKVNKEHVILGINAIVQLLLTNIEVWDSLDVYYKPSSLSHFLMYICYVIVNNSELKSKWYGSVALRLITGLILSFTILHFATINTSLLKFWNAITDPDNSEYEIEDILRAWEIDTSEQQRVYETPDSIDQSRQWSFLSYPAWLRSSSLYRTHIVINGDACNQIIECFSRFDTPELEINPNEHFIMISENTISGSMSIAIPTPQNSKLVGVFSFNNDAVGQVANLEMFRDSLTGTTNYINGYFSEGSRLIVVFEEDNNPLNINRELYSRLAQLNEVDPQTLLLSFREIINQIPDKGYEPFKNEFNRLLDILERGDIDVAEGALGEFFKDFATYDIRMPLTLNPGFYNNPIGVQDQVIFPTTAEGIVDSFNLIRYKQVPGFEAMISLFCNPTSNLTKALISIAQISSHETSQDYVQVVGFLGNLDGIYNPPHAWLEKYLDGEFDRNLDYTPGIHSEMFPFLSEATISLIYGRPQINTGELIVGELNSIIEQLENLEVKTQLAGGDIFQIHPSTEFETEVVKVVNNMAHNLRIELTTPVFLLILSLIAATFVWKRDLILKGGVKYFQSPNESWKIRNYIDKRTRHLTPEQSYSTEIFMRAAIETLRYSNIDGLSINEIYQKIISNINDSDIKNEFKRIKLSWLGKRKSILKQLINMYISSFQVYEF